MSWNNLMSWLGGDPRSAELREMRADWEQAQGLWRASPFASGSFTDIVVGFLNRAMNRYEISPASPIQVELCMVMDRLMRIGTTGEIFEGNHQPIISKSIFDRVQATLSGRLYPRTQINRFRFRRLIKCWRCGRSLTGERQKGHVYYRCHDRGCHGISIVETKLDAFVVSELEHLRVDEGDIGEFRDLLRERIVGEDAEADQRISNIRRELGSVDERMIRLTDALLDGTIDKDIYDERKKLLIGQRLTLQESLQSKDKLTFWKSVAERFELGFVALQSYIIGNDDEKREIVKIISSNLII
jgi:site-specific DNA recombinase